MAADSDRWTEVADDLNYANGVAVSPDQRPFTSTRWAAIGDQLAIDPNGQLATARISCGWTC